MKPTTLLTRYNNAVYIAACALLLTCPNGLRAITIDGHVQGLAEGYSNGYEVSFDVENGPMGVAGGELYTDLDGSILSVGFIAPLSICDNVFAPSGNPGDWNRTHKLGDLEGSDQWDLTIQYGPNNKEDIIKISLDYIQKDGSGHYEAVVKEAKDKNGAGSDIDLSSAITVASSLDYNFNVSGFPVTETSPADANWIDAIMYEWQLDTSLLSHAVTLDDLLANSLFHMSPNKQGGNKVYPTFTPTSSVPDGGATAILFALGMLGLAGVRSQFARKHSRSNS